jgi:hypothetical protein
MYLVVRDRENKPIKVYGYISMTDVVKYANNKYPDDISKWEMNVPIEYTGEVAYLPEKKDV